MNVSERPLSAAWMRAVGYAVSAPDGAEALAGILAEAGPAVGAAAALVVAGPDAAYRASWGEEEPRLLPLLAPGGALREAMPRLQASGEEPLLVRRSAPAAGGWTGGHRRALLLPLRFRGVVGGALALLFADDDPADGEADAAAYADLLSLVLENDRLYEEAREARQAREHFLTAINHELRTPATALVLTADLLRDEAGSSLAPRVQRMLRDTEEHVHQLMRVLQGVLDLSRLHDSPTAERNDIVQARQVAADTLRRVEPLARRKKLELALYAPRGLPALQTDADRLGRILLHLLSNAIRYTEAGRVEVRLERAVQRLRGERPEPVLVIRVRDTGRGIPPEELERVLEPFAQVEEGARTDSRARGLGLGLPLARRLARSLGGDLRLESAPGSGTTATLLLPYHQTGG